MAGDSNGPPSSNGANGKDPKTGKFLPGNRLGGGNPYNNKIFQLKTAILDSASPHKVKSAMAKLWKLTGSTDERIAVKALSEWLNRVCGKPEQELKLDATVQAAEIRELLLKELRGA